MVHCWSSHVRVGRFASTLLGYWEAMRCRAGLAIMRATRGVAVDGGGGVASWTLSDWDFERDGPNGSSLPETWRFVPRWEALVEPMSVDKHRFLEADTKCHEVPSRLASRDVSRRTTTSRGALLGSTEPMSRNATLVPGFAAPTSRPTRRLPCPPPKGSSVSNLALHGRNQGGAVDWRILSPDGTATLGQEMQGKVGKSAEEAINFQYSALFGF